MSVLRKPAAFRDPRHFQRLRNPDKFQILPYFFLPCISPLKILVVVFSAGLNFARTFSAPATWAPCLLWLSCLLLRTGLERDHAFG